ncbi:MAG: hypothetical protein ABEK50_10090, partial [bacterium]
TINAMALQLSPDEFGDLVDIYGGREDLEHGKVRILYAMSFVDDPTRIFRALRFTERFGFEIEEKTLFHLKNAVSDNPLESVSGDRIRQELELIFEEPKTWTILKRLFDFGVLEELQDDLMPRVEMKHWFGQVDDRVKEFSINAPEMIYYCILCEPLGPDEVNQLIDRLNFRRQAAEILRQNAHFASKRSDLKEADQPSEVYGSLTDIDHREVLVARLIMEPDTVRRKIKDYLDQYENRSPLVTGDELQKWGIEPGPEMGQILDELFKYQLDHDVDSQSELREYFEENKERLIQAREEPSA